MNTNLVKRNTWDLEFPKLPKHSMLGEFPFWDIFETNFTTNKYPPCNVIETETGFHVEAAVPGWNRSDLEVTLKNNILRIKGNKREALDEDTEKYHYKELSTKAFERAFTIGKDLEVIDVYLEHGLLNIALEKKEQYEPDTQVFDIK